ncbi:D-alanine--D-alanine ligase [Patescibacteria group bacterium]|nr:D-alanine--D-alanine ligase [Patescibacteria group bacterium]
MQNKKINIAVISGGLSNERDVSIKSGRQVFDNLSDIKYNKHLIEITKNGQWLLKENNLTVNPKKGQAKALTIMHPRQGIVKNDLKQFDVVFLALHGKFGEDGKIQSILDILRIPYTGSGVLASALGMNKTKTLEFLKNSGISLPKFLSLAKNKKNDIKTIDKLILKKIKYPCVVKPNESGSSIGISVVSSSKKLGKALRDAFREDDAILIEEFIAGREITCGVLGNSKQTKLIALPPVEIISKNDFFDYEAKYFSEQTMEICPAKITASLTKKIQELAKKIHDLLGCDGLTRSDFILKNNKFYFLEINTLPGLTEQSLCPKEARATGISFGEFLDKQVDLAMKKYGKKVKPKSKGWSA